MRKIIALIFIITGLLIIGFTSFDMIQAKSSQNKALETAKEIVKESNGNNGAKDEENVEDSYEMTRNDFLPKQGDVIGILHIPRLDAELPIVEGTDEDELDVGVGHFSKTAFPTDGKQILLSGHRDTVFRNLGDLEIGDVFEVKMPYGTFVYEIEETFIVDANDTTVIDYSIDEELLTVSTCYPFRYVGNAPDRYIINAKPVNQ